MKSCRTIRSVSLSSLFALVLCAPSLLGSCRAPLVGTGPSSRATISLSIVGSPPASRSTASRLLLPNASWIRLTLTDGLESETYTQAEASPTFTVTVVVDREYNLVAEAGTTSEGEDTILYRGSTTFTAAGYQTISLNLLPNEIEAWPEIDADSYTFEGSIYGKNSITYRVRMGSAARWYVDGYTEDETDLQLYFQNEDGSAVTPAVSMADRLIVEKSMLTADADSFLLTLYNASSDTGSSISPSMTSVRAYTGDLVYCDTVATIATNSWPADITFLGGKLYIAMNNGSSVVSLDTDGTNETVFFDGSTTYTTPWGITNDGTDIYIAFQYGNDGSAVKIDPDSGVITFSAAIPRASGIAALGDYVYVTSNTENIVYRVLKESSGTVTAEIAAGSGTQASTDDTGTDASFYNPAGICTDGTYLYVVDAGSFRIRRIDPTTMAVTTIAGNETVDIVDGTGTAASFSGINHIMSDGTYLYVTDSNTLRRIDVATRQVETIYEFSDFNGGGLAKVGDAFYIVNNDGNDLYKVY